jgi:hypothetical protein
VRVSSHTAASMPSARCFDFRPGTARTADEDAGFVFGDSTTAHHNIGSCRAGQHRHPTPAWRPQRCSESISGELSMWWLFFSASRSSKIIATNSESVSWQCRVAGRILRSSRPPQNRTCEFPRIRLKHLPACRVSAALVWRICSCTMHSTCGWRGTYLASSTSGTRTMPFVTARAEEARALWSVLADRFSTCNFASGLEAVTIV